MAGGAEQELINSRIEQMKKFDERAAVPKSENADKITTLNDNIERPKAARPRGLIHADMKTKRVNLVVRPAAYEHFKQKAYEMGRSVNDLINEIMENY